MAVNRCLDTLFQYKMGLVETKNGAVLRKHLGYAHIPQKSAERLNEFNRDFLNVYINFHRPCFFPLPMIDGKGKVKKTYPYQEVRTPYERLKSLPKAESHLRPGVSFESLDAIAYQMSDNEFAERRQQKERVITTPPRPISGLEKTKPELPLRFPLESRTCTRSSRSDKIIEKLGCCKLSASGWLLRE